MQSPLPQPFSAVVDHAEAAEVSLLDPTGAVPHTEATSRLPCATMTGTDLAVYEMDRTYAQLA